MPLHRRNSTGQVEGDYLEEITEAAELEEDHLHEITCSAPKVPPPSSINWLSVEYFWIISRISCVSVELRVNTSSTSPELSSWSATTPLALAVGLCTRSALKSGRINFSVFWIKPRKDKRNFATGLRSRNCKTCGSNRDTTWWLMPATVNVEEAR